MKTINYKTEGYYFLRECLTDIQFAKLIDGIDNLLATNYGTADFIFTHINKKCQKCIDRYVAQLKKMILEAMEENA